MFEIFLSLATAAIAIGVVAIVGLCIASHYDVFNNNDWF